MHGAPNGYGGTAKSQQCHKYFLQYRTYASKRPQFRIWGCQTCFLLRAPSNLITPLHDTHNNKLIKVNLPPHEVCTIASINKKRNHLICCDCSRWISSASCEKCDFNPISRVFFIRGSTSLIEFVFFILFRQKQKIRARKGRFLACNQKCKSPIELRFQYSGMLKSDT